MTVYRGALYRPRLGPGDAHLGGPRWSPDGQGVLLATREAPETTLLLVSADGTTQRRLLTVEGTLVCWDWSPDGRWAVVVVQGEDTSLETCAWWTWPGARPGCCGGSPTAPTSSRWRRWSPDPGGPPRLVFRSNRSGWAKLWTATFRYPG